MEMKMDNIDMTGGKANMAFIGDRKDIWHRLGEQMQAGMSIEEWAEKSGLLWEAVLVPAIPALEGAQFDHLDPQNRFRPVPNRKFIVRQDNGLPLGYASSGYQPVQPKDVLDWFDRYIRVDDRFQLDVAGSLGHGERIWATATFRDPLDIGGDKHVARLLMTTSFDTTAATVNQGTLTRVVCQNTLNAALADHRAVIKTSHRSKFDPVKVGKELAAIAQGFAEYKKMGDAMAQNHMTAKEVSDFFKAILDIDPNDKWDELSTRKQNQFHALGDAYKVTKKEGHAEDAWAALQSVTRWVDHDRATKKGEFGEDEARFTSAQFGSGSALKSKAIGLLLPRIKDKVLIPA
jgi:phage/plasmid-like protein (TIGR03299 family)